MRTGTCLARSRMGLDKILLFKYAWSTDIEKINYCKYQLGISKNTAVDFNMYMREVRTWIMIDSSEKIGGRDCMFEIDASLFCKSKSNMGRLYPQFGFLEDNVIVRQRKSSL